jgi:hypothetical protein
MRVKVAITLAAHIGQMLTPELAASIAREICATPDKSRNPADYPPTEYKGYVLAMERFSEVLPELHTLHQRHYLEVDTSGTPMNPDYDAARASEHDGNLMQFTARVKATGELVGNMRVYLGMSRHTQTMFAHEDTFYVTPEHRGGFMAVRLWQFTEACVIKAGVREIFFDSKTLNHADSMARYLKYTLVAMKFSKTIPESKE